MQGTEHHARLRPVVCFSRVAAVIAWVSLAGACHGDAVGPGARPCRIDADCESWVPVCVDGRCSPCVTDAFCATSGGYCVQGSCAQCRADADCPAGEGCDSGTCALRCDVLSCSPDQACLDPFGTCRSVECSDRKACDNGDVCVQFGCYDRTGRCSPTAPCPIFRPQDAPQVPTECGAAGRCRVSPAAPFLPMDLYPDSKRPIEIESPSPGKVFQAGERAEVVWASAGPESSYIVLVLTAGPADTRALPATAVWGATVREGGRRRLTWADGVVVSEGRFRRGQRWMAPPGRYQLLVQAVRRGTLQAVSPLVPFALERAWPGEGAPCGDSAGCEDPATARVCQAHRCRRLCASDLDCGPGGGCLAPVGDVRVCRAR